MSHESVTIRWESATRYYTAVLHRDLLDDWVLTVARGGRRNRLGRVEHKVVASREQGLAELEALDRKRTRRGYAKTFANNTF